MVLRYTVASAAERLPKIGYVLKANPRKLFDKCSLLASFIMRSDLESKYAIKEAWSNQNLKGPLPYM